MRFMGEKLRSICVCILLAMGMLIVVDIQIDINERASAEVIYVNTTGDNGAYTRIQEAINSANDGDTVFVYSGSYNEKLLVNRSINLTGEARDNTIINGGGAGDTICVSVNWVNITGFTVIGSGLNAQDAGIELQNVQYCSIFNNIVRSNNNNGIYLFSSSNNEIAWNSVTSNNWYGIYLYSSGLSGGNSIYGNYLSTNDRGIFLEESSNNNVSGNIAQDNEDGIYLKNSGYNDIFGNTVSTNFGYGIYLNSSDDNTILTNVASTNQYGIYLDVTVNNDIINNTVYWSTKSGIFIHSSNQNNITYNEVFSNDRYGISIQFSNLNNILDNNASSNDYGIGILFSNGNVIKGNDIWSNGEGINISSSWNNRIHHNNLLDNMIQAYDDSALNFWNETYPTSGNFWSDYGGMDNQRGPAQNISGSDGVGDTNYTIDTDSVDHYPLINPYPDYIAPKIQLLYPGNNSIIQAGEILDFDIIDDNLYQVNYSINGGNETPFTEPYDMDTTFWDDDDYTIKINALDIMGNFNSSWYFIGIDTVWPIITFLSPGDNSFSISGTPLNFTIVDSHLDHVNYSLNGGVDILLSEPFDIPTEGWPDGDYTIQINSIDKAGNKNSNLFFFTIDSTKSVLLFKSHENNSVVQPGTVLDFDIIDSNLVEAFYSINGMAENPFYSPHEIYTMGWEDGNYSIRIRALDLAGNTNSSLYMITVDSVLPTIQLNAPENNTIITGGTILNLTIFDLNLLHVNYSRNGEADIFISEPFEISTSGWEDGDHIVHVNAMDKAGNSYSCWFNFTLDSTFVTIILNSPLNNSVLYSVDILDFYVFDSHLVSVNYSINGGNNIPISGSYDIPSAGWGNGEYIIRFNAQDKAGNFNSPWFIVIIDSVDPKIILLSPENNSVLFSNEVYSFDVIDSNLRQVNYSIAGSKYIPISKPFNISTSGWSDGDYIIQINAVDWAGNKDSKMFFFSIDSTKPIVVLNSPENESINPRGTVLFFSVMDSHLHTVNYSLDGGFENQLDPPFDISTQGWADGEHIVQINSFDVVGNFNSFLFIIIIDSTCPSIFIRNIENNSVVQNETVLEFEIEDASIVWANYSVNGGVQITMNESYNITTLGWSDGSYTILIKALDYVGNSNSAWFNVTVDSTSPTLWLDPAINHSTMPVGANIPVHAYDINLDKVMCSLDEGEYYVLSPSDIVKTTGWRDGSHIVHIKPIDKAGNELVRWFEVNIDAVFPYVVSAVLIENPEQEGIDTIITIMFSESINQTDIKDQVIISPYSNFDCEWNQDGTVLSISFPEGELSEEATYWIMIRREVEDIHGNPMNNDFEFVFTTKSKTQGSEPAPTSSSGTSFPYWILFLFVITVLIIILLFFIYIRRLIGGDVEIKPPGAKPKALEVKSLPLVSGPIQVWQRLKCPTCNTVFKVEGGSKSRQIKCPNCGATGDGIARDYGAAAKVKEPKTPEKRPVSLTRKIRCPSCKETFHVDVSAGITQIKCPVCGMEGKIPGVEKTSEISIPNSIADHLMDKPVSVIRRLRCPECLGLIKVKEEDITSLIKCQNCGAEGRFAG